MKPSQNKEKVRPQDQEKAKPPHDKEKVKPAQDQAKAKQKLVDVKSRTTGENVNLPEQLPRESSLLKPERHQGVDSLAF